MRISDWSSDVCSSDLRGQGGGRLQLSVYHTWHLESRIDIRDGLPILDLLNGDASGSSGGQPRHEVEMRAGYSNNGLGVRLNADRSEARRVRHGFVSTCRSWWWPDV